LSSSPTIGPNALDDGAHLIDPELIASSRRERLLGLSAGVASRLGPLE
jgi:hypothetical protein